MSALDRVKNIAMVVLLLASCLIILLIPEIGLLIIMIILSISLLVYAIRKLIYYFAMARHMVGGRIMLYLGVIAFDAAVFLLSITEVRSAYVMIYLIFIYAFSGVMGLLQAFEQKKMGVPSWKLKFAQAVFNLCLVLACGICITKQDVCIYIFCFGLVYNAVTRIISAFRKTAIVYIQ